MERKRARLQLEKDIASLRETLRYAEIKSNVTMIDSAVISEPNAVKTIISLIKKEPLDIWLESNGRWADFVHILSQISKSHSKFIQAAEQLDLNLRLFIRNYNASKNIMDFFDDGS